MRNIIIPVAAGLVGAAAGFYFGKVYGDNKGRKDVWEIAEAEIANTEERIKRRYKLGEWSEPTEYFDIDLNPVQTLDESFDYQGTAEKILADPVAMENLRQHIEAGGYATLSEPEETQNIFQVAEEDHSNPNRDDPEPTIITELEYFNEEEDYDKLSVSWYPSDRVLCDSREQPIDDVEGTVGINNLNGVGADRTVIYIRNNRLKMDFEIACELGSYRETVLGEDQPVIERSRRKPRAKVDVDE